MKETLNSLFSGPQGDTSIKRVIGAICSLALVVCLYLKKTFDPTIVTSVTTLAVACIGGTVIEKFSTHIKDCVEPQSDTDQ